MLYWPLIPALVAYAYLAIHYNFIQDDSYISYRYVANFLNGNGLVFNIGEYVEGYTNFGWVIYMLFCAVVGIGYIGASQITGALFGAGIIILTHRLAIELFGREGHLYIAGATLLLGLNQALAYWSPAGLETSAFAFCALWAVYLYIHRSWMLIFALVMAVWLRPEGAFVTGLLILVEFLQTRRLPMFTLKSALIAFVLSLPYVGFKLFYYGEILPNPFYAKTSFSMAQLADGLEYILRYFDNFLFYYVGVAFLVLPVMFLRRLSRPAIAIVLVVWFYILYILLIGGDVLKVHRFFLPLMGPILIVVFLSFRFLLQKMKNSARTSVMILVILVTGYVTFNLPSSFVKKYNFNERKFVEKMEFKAEQLLATDSTDFSVALPTIGMYSYKLLGHDVIDLVGLTDTTIARHSEEPIPGMATTWKEQKHNSKYLLSLAPDYIVFSTGVKPSAPAERALLLYPEFLHSYRTVGWFYPSERNPNVGIITIAYKKMRPVEGPLVPVYPIEYVQAFKNGLDAHSKNDHARAIQYFDQAIRIAPEVFNPNLLYQRAYSHLRLNEWPTAKRMLDSLIAIDSMVFEAHKDAYHIERVLGNTAKAQIHEHWLKKLVPWYWPRVKAKVDQQLTRARQGR